MGHIILPNGKSVQTDKLKGSIAFHTIIDDIKSPLYTHVFRANLIVAIANIDDYGGFTTEIIRYLHELTGKENAILAEAARYTLEKISPNFKLKPK